MKFSLNRMKLSIERMKFSIERMKFSIERMKFFIDRIKFSIEKIKFSFERIKFSHLNPKEFGREYPKTLSSLPHPKLFFWPCMPDFGSIGRVQIVFSMYSYRLATFLSNN